MTVTDSQQQLTEAHRWLIETLESATELLEQAELSCGESERTFYGRPEFARAKLHIQSAWRNVGYALETIKQQ